MTMLWAVLGLAFGLPAICALGIWAARSVDSRKLQSDDKPTETAGDPYVGFTGKDFYNLALATVAREQPDILASGERQMAHWAAVRARHDKDEPPRLRRQIMGWIDYYEGRSRDRLKREAQNVRTDRLRQIVKSEALKRTKSE